MECIEDMITRARHLSGALKEPADILYSSFHLPKFTIENATRNTLHRFNQFNIPQDLQGKTVLDLGSNTGAMSFEFARRGASVVGVEYNSDRVAFCNELSKTLNLPAVFYTYDLNQGLPKEINREFDIVSCMALDAYMDDRFALYQLMIERTRGMCYFESNYPNSDSRDFKIEVEDIKNYCLKHIPFVIFIGWSTPGGRRIFSMSRYYMFFSRQNWQRKQFHSYDDWFVVHNALKTINLPQVPLHKIDEPHFIDRWIYSDVKTYREINKNDHNLMSNYRQQMIDFLIGLNKYGYAHRDLHLGNLLFQGRKLLVIDWEWVTENRVPLRESYDLTGKGCALPGASSTIGAQTIFFSYGAPSIADFFSITMNDFPD